MANPLTLETLRKYTDEFRTIGPDYVRRLWNRHTFRPEYDLAIVGPPGPRAYWAPEHIFRPGQAKEPIAQLTIYIIEDLMRRVTYTLKYDIYPSGLILKSEEPVPYQNRGAQSAYSGIPEEWMYIVLKKETTAAEAARAHKRCAAVKEELAATVWAPARVAARLEAGVDLESL